MSLNPKTQYFLLLILVLLAGRAIAAVVDPDTVHAGMEIDPATARVVYDRSADLPDGDAFLAIVRTLDLMDRESALSWIEHGMGLSGTDSEKFLDRLLSTFATFIVDMDRQTARMACSQERDLAKDDVYAIFEAVDDGRTALAAQHLALVKAEVGVDTAARLQQWLEANKLAITKVNQRHKAVYEQAGADVHARLTAICNRLASPQ